jgi:cytochrome c-type biogenesis protein CcmH
MALLAALFILMLSLGGVISFGKKSSGGDISVALRALLLARAEGKIGQEEFERGQAALHATLLAASADAPAVSRHLWWVIPLFFVVAAVAGYLFTTTPTGTEQETAAMTSSRVILPPSGTMSQGGRNNAHANPMSSLQENGQNGVAASAQVQSNSGGDLSTMVKRLADKMAKNPGNGDGWLLLARTYGELRQHKEAASAYAKAAAILPPDATMLADWADARVVANERKWDAESADIVRRALAADPRHLKALSLAGSEAFEHGDHKKAISFWKRILSAAQADSMDAKLAEKNIEEANKLLSSTTSK